MKESFIITEVSRGDLEGIGFDTSEISDETMERLARKLGDDYCEQLFWTSLEIIAEYLEIPKKNIKTLQVGDKVKWYDPEIEARDLSIVWTIDEIRGSLDDEDTIILITSEYGSEAEVLQKELIKV